VKRAVDSFPLRANRIEPQFCVFGFSGSAHQKGVLHVCILHKRFKRPGAKLFRQAEILNSCRFVRPHRAPEELAGLCAFFVQQNRLEAGLQSIVQRMPHSVVTAKPELRSKLASVGLAEKFLADVMIKGVKPLVGDAAGPGILASEKLRVAGV